MLRTAGLIALVCLTPSLADAQVQRPRDHITQCFACHGDDGIAKDREVPHLAGQNEVYLYNQLRNFKAGKRPHKEMRVMSRDMDDGEMREIAAYFAALPTR